MALSNRSRPLWEIEAHAAILTHPIICQKAWALGLRSTFPDLGYHVLVSLRASLAGPCLHDSRAPTDGRQLFHPGLGRVVGVGWLVDVGCIAATPLLDPSLLLLMLLLLLLLLLRDQHSNRSGEGRRVASMKQRHFISASASQCGRHRVGTPALDPAFDFGSFGGVRLASQ